MAVLRVSSYRRLFEEDRWGRSKGSAVTPTRSAVDKCDCDRLDFVTAKTLNTAGRGQFVRDRTAIAALNDRLVKLVEVAHCFEEENETLEHQIDDLKEKLNVQTDSRKVSTVKLPDYSLDAVVDRLRRQTDKTLCDTEEVHKELQQMQTECEKVSQRRILIQQEQQTISEEVDAATAECLALREQVAIYEEQLASMEAQHTTEVKSLLKPDDGMCGAVAVQFSLPDITPVLEVKQYYCQLAQSLQCDCGVSSAKVRGSDGKGAGGTGGSTVRELPNIKDDSEFKALVSELQDELADLEMCNRELQREVEIKEVMYMEEIAKLECTVEEVRQQESSLEAQMKEQCDDFQELLREKMARDLEIVAYRSLMEEEETKLTQRLQKVIPDLIPPPLSLKLGLIAGS